MDVWFFDCTPEQHLERIIHSDVVVAYDIVPSLSFDSAPVVNFGESTLYRLFCRRVATR